MQQYRREIADAMNALQAAAEKVEGDQARPVFHFRPPAQWMNDPNGTIFHDGWYHVFYQSNPFADEWGQIHWGHTRSRDLVHWEHLPIGLWPSKELGEDHCFSGCIAINHRKQPVAFYTSIGQEHQVYESAEQWAAIGDFELINWSKYEKNPILHGAIHGDARVYEWRDPFVFHANGRTFMVLGGKLDQAEGGEAVVTLYAADSKDLLQWAYRGILFRHPDPNLRSVECPNFLALGSKWFLLDSPYGPVEYFLGDFDAQQGAFTWNKQGLIDQTDSFYATNVLYDDQNRCILLGWIRGFAPHQGWNGCLALPRLVSLDQTGNLRQEPVPALQQLRGSTYRYTDTAVVPKHPVISEVEGDCVEVIAQLNLGEADCVGLRLQTDAQGQQGTEISFTQGTVTIAGTAISLAPDQRKVLLHAFLDRTVLEVFVNYQQVVTKVLPYERAHRGVCLFAEGGQGYAEELSVWQVEPVW